MSTVDNNNIDNINNASTNVDNTNAPINVYHVKEHPHSTGWIILCFILMTIIIILILFWVYTTHNSTNNNTICGTGCYGELGLQFGYDNTAINACGTGNNNPCIFLMGTLQQAAAQCATLSNICKAFSYNSSTQQMKIINTNNPFISLGTNIYVPQSCPMSLSS